MKYGILPWPHSNSRYQDAIRPLSRSELALMLDDRDALESFRFERVADAEFLCFESALAPARVARALADMAHLFLLCEMRGDGSLIPMPARREAFLGADLTGILKYKGKTNEVFTRYLINAALYSSAFRALSQKRLQFLDPMCGRGTALFDALNRGWDAFGADVNRQDIHEADVFFRRYLEYHKWKHQTKEMSMTLPGKRAVARKQYRFAPEGAAARDGGELSLMQGDAADIIRAFPPKRFHIAAMDLPYGVQHASGSKAKPEALPAMLERILPELLDRLLPGGAVALSFNANVLPLRKTKSLLEAAGFDVMEGIPYDRLAHWVEQAITRDVAIGVKGKR